MELRSDNASFLKDIDTVMFDCDGVLWDAMAQPIEGAVKVLEMIRKLGKRVFFVTNNSTKTRQQYAERCQNFGIQASEDEIICTSWLIAAYLKDVLKFEGKTYLVGGAALATEFENKGLDFIGPGVETYGDVEAGYASYLAVNLDPDVKAVAVGFDPYINYVKVVKAASYLNNSSCIYVGSNADANFPSKGDIKIPGTGSIIGFVTVAAGRDPVIVGKPSMLSKEILETIHGQFNCDQTLMVGDRLDTDIKFGKNCGFRTLAVMTGITTLSEIREKMASNSVEDQKCVPSYYIQSVGHLAPFLSEGL